ncbi:unnamed protein product [Ectocarpus sp. 12 AP-2014]
MMCVQLSRPSLLSLVAAGLLTPSRGIAVSNCAGLRGSLFSAARVPPVSPLPSAGDHRHHHLHGRRRRRRRLAPGGGSWSGGTHGLRLLSSPSSGAHEGGTGRRSSGSNQQQQRHQGGGSSGDGGARRTEDTGRPSSSLPARQREARTRRHRGRQGGGWGGDGDRREDWGGDLGRSLVEEEREAQEVQGAVALAAAKRGPGERGRLVASESPVEEFVIRGRRVLVKRDDKMRLAESGLSGNKARKLYALNKTPAASFPEVVASHGGPQSNAMVAIAAVVASKPGSSFIYYTKPVPKWLRRNPVGNFARTIALGAEIMEVHTEDYKRIFGGADGPGASYSEVVPEEALFLPQGGADAAAEEGVSMLADEIIDYWDENGPPGKELRVILPAGTGTTALFLARHLVPEGIPVLTVPCAGDSGYLYRQMAKVDRASGGVGIFPQCVQETRKRKAAFGVPKRELLEVWRELDKAGLFVDLLYAAPAWEVIMDSWDTSGSPVSVTPGPPVDSEPQLMYVHCGGLEGVSSQLTRYKHQGLVQDGQLQ